MPIREKKDTTSQPQVFSRTTRWRSVCKNNKLKEESFKIINSVTRLCRVASFISREYFEDFAKDSCEKKEPFCNAEFDIPLQTLWDGFFRVAVSSTKLGMTSKDATRQAAYNCARPRLTKVAQELAAKRYLPVDLDAIPHTHWLAQMRKA